MAATRSETSWIPDGTVASLVQTHSDEFRAKSLKSLVKLQQMFRTAEIELGMEHTIGITLEAGVGVQSAILHVCRLFVVLLPLMPTIMMMIIPAHKEVAGVVVLIYL